MTVIVLKPSSSSKIGVAGDVASSDSIGDSRTMSKLLRAAFGTLRTVDIALDKSVDTKLILFMYGWNLNRESFESGGLDCSKGALNNWASKIGSDYAFT